jgi:hypothetical protein
MVVVVFLSLASLGVIAAEPAPTRLWTGVNGKTISGSLCQLTPDREKVEILLADGKTVTIALSNLISADREIALSGGQSSATAEGLFKPITPPNRKLMMALDPEKSGFESNSAMIDAIWLSFLWWDQAGVLEIPKKGDFEAKAEWLYKKLVRYTLNGEDNLSAEETKKGVEAYFKAEYDKVAACQIRFEKKDFTALRLSELAQGANVVLLRMSMEYADKNVFTMAAALESMSEDGSFVLHLMGKRLTGKLRRTEFNPREPRKPVASELVLDQPGELPDFYRAQSPRFYVGQSSWNAAIVLKPYVYLTPGKVVPLPPP